MTDSRDDSFVGRWSRRKRLARAGRPEVRETDQSDSAQTGTAPAEAVATDDAGDPDVIARLPDLSTADDSTDFTGFMQKGVPEVLRRQALRKLWRVNPVLANLDGLNDYDEDYTQLSAWGRGMKTLYKVGEGFATGDQPPASPEAGATRPADTDVRASPQAEATPDPTSAAATSATATSAAAEAQPRDAAAAKSKGAARARRWNLGREAG